MKARLLIKFFLILTFLLSATSCNKERDIKVLSTQTRLERGSDNELRMVVTVRFDNNSSKIVLNKAWINILRKKDYKMLASVEIAEKIIIPRGDESVDIPLRIKASGGVIGMMALSKQIEKAPMDIYVKGSVKGRAGIIPFDMEYGVTFDRFLSKLKEMGLIALDATKIF